MRNERRRYFLRYIILYLCVLLPLLCASVFSNRLVTDALYSTATHQAQAGVDAVSDSLTTLYSEYTTASNFLTNYYLLSGRVMGRGSQEAAQGITFLNFANQFDSWTTDIFMSYGEEVVYSGKGLSRLTTLLDSTLQCTQQSIRDAEEVVAATANATACLYSGGDFNLQVFFFRQTAGAAAAAAETASLNALALAIRADLPG